MADIRNTTIEVDIVTPEGVQLSLRPADVPQGMQGDLLHVHTHNDMAEPCGTFQLTFAGRAINGLTWDELIPLRSEVTIRLQDPRNPVNRTAAVVMRGLTDDHAVQETYTQRVPQRVVTISGRSGAGLLLDAHLFYHPLLQRDPSLGTLRVDERDFKLFWQTTGLVGYEIDPRRALGLLLTYYLGLPSAVPLTRQSVASETPSSQAPTSQAPAPGGLGAAPQASPAQQALTMRVPAETDALASQRFVDEMLRRDPTLSRAQAEDNLRWAQQMEARGGGALLTPLGTAAQRRQQTQALATQQAAKPPASPTPPKPLETSNQLLNLDLPGKRTVADLLVYREDQATLFTPGVTVFTGTDAPEAGALWNYMQLFHDTLMQELFSRIEGGTCRLHFRGKPFLKEFTGTGSRFVTDEPTLETLELPWGEVLSRQQRRQMSQIYNFFLVLPLGAMLLRDDPGFRYSLAPTVLRDADDPGAVTRYGIRVLQHSSPYLSATRIMPTSDGKKLSTSPLNTKDPTVKTAMEWSKWASVWYGWGAEMYVGFVTLPGSPRYNLGQRLTWNEPRGKREAYCEGIDHDWDARTGLYTSQLRYTRAWYLDGPVDRRTRSSHNGTVPAVAGSGAA